MRSLDYIVFGVLFLSHVVAVLYSPIQDCDEVFNFWEPTHYLNHGYGMQTWELSPVYAIRSWLYVSIHALPISFISQLPSLNNKALEFYGLRCLLALVCAISETRLYQVLSACVNPRIALLFLISSLSGAGMFHAATSYLPSTFAMYTVTFAVASFIDTRKGSQTASGLIWLAVGTVLGWPFVGILSLPFVLEEVVSSIATNEVSQSITGLIKGAAGSLTVLGLEIAVDSLFFKELTSVPFNIVTYNILGGSSKGPDIYGTEPWHFYVRNLLINYNIWFCLALLTLPLLLLTQGRPVNIGNRLSMARNLVIASPFYLWLLIFTIQPHKEERFMYPIYPCISLNAALSLHIIITYFSHPSPSKGGPQISATVRFLGLGTIIISAVFAGIWRSAGLATAYSAPLNIYSALEPYSLAVITDATANVCVGKEWYRFPSSYHLPSNMRLKFIRSEFHGLLPGTFSEAKTGLRYGLNAFPGTSLIPEGMNDENREDLGKYTNIKQCDFLVDSLFEGQESDAEPIYRDDIDTWETVRCEPFLDAGRTHFIGRLGWIPDSELVPGKLRRRWGEYCLLKRRDPDAFSSSRAQGTV